jgi:hypothetical protein
MADNQQSGLFYNKEVDRVLGTVHDDLLRAQQQARADQAALKAEQQALVEAQNKAVSDRESAMAKAMKDQLELEQKAAEKRAKQASDMQADVPTLASAQWGGQGEALQQAANYIRENLDKGDNLIESLGAEKTQYLIAQLDEAAKNMHSSFVKSSELGRKNNSSYNSRKEGDKEFVDFSDDTYFAAQDSLNARGQFSPSVNMEKGEWDFGGGKPIAQWVTEEDKRNMDMMTAIKKAGYPATVKLAWDLDGKSYLTQTPDSMLQTLDDILGSAPVETEDGQLRYHPWQLTAMNVAYDDYVVNGEGEPMTYDRYFNTGPAAAENRQNAYDNFEEEWMRIFNQEQKYKNRKKSSGGGSSGSTASGQDLVETATIGQMQENDTVKKTLYQNFYNTEKDPPFGYDTPEFEELYGIKGLTSNLKLPVDLTGNPKEIAFFNIAPGDPSISVEAASLSKEGNMFVAYKGRINTMDRSQVRLNDDIMNNLGIQDIAEDKRPDVSADIRVIPFGTRQWKNIVIEAGKRVARLKTDRTTLKKAFKDIRGNDEAVYFYVGLMALSNQTNSLFMDEIRADLKADGLTEAEIDSIATLAKP